MLLPTKKRGDSTWRGVISGSRKANVSGDFIKLIKLLLQFKRVTGVGGVYSCYRFWENLKYERQHLWRLACSWSKKQGDLLKSYKKLLGFRLLFNLVSIWLYLQTLAENMKTWDLLFGDPGNQELLGVTVLCCKQWLNESQHSTENLPLYFPPPDCSFPNFAQ